MTLVASIRRAVLVDEARGHIVEDENPILDNFPQIVIEPEPEEKPFLDFTDGLGWDSGINAYEGYGSKYIWTSNGSPPKSLIGQKVDNANQGDVLSFNEETGLYEPIQAAIVGDVVPTDGQVLAWDEVEGKYNPIDLDDLLFEEDSITLVVEKPTNRTYPIVVSSVTDIEITGGTYNFESGPGSATLPSGNYNAGSSISVSVSGTNATTEFLVVQINYRKPLIA